MAPDVALLAESFDLLAPQGDELMTAFYDRLFELDPEARSLFSGTDMAEQKKKLLSTLVLVRQSLTNLPTLVPALKALGQRHAGYGVTAEHYDVVGQALLSAMSDLAGPRWKVEYTAAWTEAYGVIQGVMIEDASEQVA